ncbi:MAG: VWA domain-containing protein [Pseudomonadota bacterium]
MRKKRRTDVFSLSFLDCMSCGFGAVILFFMIINATVSEQADLETSEELSEVRKIEQEVLEGRKNLVVLRNAIREANDEVARADNESVELLRRIQELQEQLAQYDGTTLAKRESEEKLRSDIKQLEEARRRLAAETSTAGPTGKQVRTFTGDGTRQYLTGLRVRGKRTLILVDASASMLDETIVNVIRRRNQSKEAQLRAAKWRQTVASVDWITTQLLPDTQFQIYRFGDTAEPLIAGSDGVWLDVGDGTQLEQAVKSLRENPPTGGTNLYDAFSVARRLDPRPDNILLLVDGLPTVGVNAPAKSTVSAGERRTLFGQAVRRLPGSIPINVLMYPMEGDVLAPSEYWRLAYRTGGSFMSVSDDWP